MHTPSHRITLRSILILSSHLRLGLPGILTKMYIFLISSLRATCLAHFIVLNLMPLAIFREAPHYVVSSSQPLAASTFLHVSYIHTWYSVSVRVMNEWWSCLRFELCSHRVPVHPQCLVLNERTNFLHRMSQHAILHLIGNTRCVNTTQTLFPQVWTKHFSRYSGTRDRWQWKCDTAVH
jgi:hypothetical protein